MAGEITVSISLTATDGVVTEQLGSDGATVTYTLDQSHAAMRRYTKRVRGLKLAKCRADEDKYGFSIGNSIDMMAEREKNLAGEPVSATYQYNYLDFGVDIWNPKIAAFYNMGEDYPIWICTLYRATDNDTYTIIPFLEVPPGNTVGPTTYPILANNQCDKITEAPMWFAMVGLPKNYTGNPEQVYRTLYIIVYDS